MVERNVLAKQFIAAWEAWANLLEQEAQSLKSAGSRIHAQLDNGEKILARARELAIAEVLGHK